MAQIYSDIPPAFARELGMTDVGDGRFAEFFAGETNRDNLAAMDKRREEIEARLDRPIPVQRTKIGRNSTCPCGSGLKFKKCCIGKAAISPPDGPRPRS